MFLNFIAQNISQKTLKLNLNCINKMQCLDVCIYTLRGGEFYTRLLHQTLL